jgi:uncharacterized protein DUF5655/uncharacterized protein DUF4287
VLRELGRPEHARAAQECALDLIQNSAERPLLERRLFSPGDTTMPTPEEGIQSQLRNIESTYSRSIDELVAEVAGSGLTKHTEVVAMLKQRHGMTHGAAHRVSLVARDRLGGPQSHVSAAPPGSLQAVYEELLQAITALGDDIEQAPKKGYLSLRRRKQFAMLQSATKWVNLGLILPGVELGGRLESAAKWNALFTHRVRVASAAEIDEEIRAWLRDAYLTAG